ncbi:MULTISPECIES: hypothetical protein [unclassified Lysinibacillus]|uniref:hypothetical protein n=1 Tax=unclassified Lysinibacillus TaxID=2636778 RepID=UPI0038088F73
MTTKENEILAPEYLMQKAERGLEMYEDLLEEGLVTEGQEVEVMTLFNSCYSRYIDTKYGHKAWYIKKEYPYDSPEHFVWSILIEKPDFWTKWINQTMRYGESGWEPNYRPTIDRLDDSKGYFLYNIQVLSFRNNALKNNQFVFL